MIRADGQLVLIDFGTAREVTETYMSKRSEGQVTGLFSAGYSPLEQLNGQAVPQSDFFALGRTFVFLITGRHPSEFYDSYVDHLNWRDSIPTISPIFADFLDRLMARLPSQRPQSARAIVQELEEIHRTLYGTDPNSRMKHSGSSVSDRDKQNAPKVDPSVAKTTELLPKTTRPTSEPKLPSEDKKANADAKLDPSIVARIQQEFAQFIGPMASIICQRLLSKNPTMSVTEFVQALAQKIPDSKQAEEFQKRCLK
jgi:serine/threonine protein kinase